MKKINKILLLVLSLGMLLLTSCSSGDVATDTKIYTGENLVASSDGDVDHTKVVFEIQNYGTFTVETYPEHAPETVAHFLDLVSIGYYDGSTFEKINPGRSMISSSLTALSSGECKETVTGEFEKNGYSNELPLTRGTLAFRYLPGEYDSATSSFMILLKDEPSLESSYAGFAKVVDGISIFDAVANSPVTEDNTPVLPIVMKKVYIKD